MRFIYTGDVAAGSVTYTHPTHGSVTFPRGEPVEAPAWIAGKLAANGEFKAVPDAPVEVDPPVAVVDEKRKPGRPRKFEL